MDSKTKEVNRAKAVGLKRLKRRRIVYARTLMKKQSKRAAKAKPFVTPVVPKPVVQKKTWLARFTAWILSFFYGK